MGSAVKAIVGIALMLAAPGIGAWAAGGAFAWGTTIASLSGIGLATAIGVTLVAASLAGSALTADIGDTAGTESYAGVKLQTQKSNVSPVPQVFGYNRLAGNIIWQQTNNKVNNNTADNGYNRDYWAIIALAGHTIEDITTIYGNALALTDKGSNKFTSAYTHIKWYNASSSTTNLNDISFVKTESGTAETYGGILSVFGSSQLTLSTNNTATNRGYLLDRTDTYWSLNGTSGTIDVDLGADGTLTNLQFYFRKVSGVGNYIYYNLKIQY